MTNFPAAVSIEPLGDGAAVVAFDIGGTDIKAALFDASGAMLGLTRVPTPHRGVHTVDAVMQEIAELTAGFAADFPLVQPLAVGLIAPGIVDDDRGIGIHAANLQWADAPFKHLAEKRLGMPASFSHDVRAAGEAEFRLGAALPYRDVAVVVIGTGIAASLFIGGRPHSAGGYAGELGHSIVDPAGELCACGSTGCLETIASAGAIVRRYERATGSKLPGAKEIIERARNGDSEAQSIWNDALDALALSIAQLAAVLAPEAIVIGGGLAQAGDALLVPLRTRVDNLLSFQRLPVVVAASIGENAGLLGAALHARAAAVAAGMRP